jgi:hypothetical protein
MIPFDKFARHFNRFLDVGAVIDVHEVDLATVDTAPIVDYFKVHSLGVSDGTVFR